MKTERNILIAFLLNLSFSVFEFLGGLFTGSVAIVSDALHDLGDALSIGLSLFLERKSKCPPDDTYTYGYARYSVLGGFINTAILLTGSVIMVATMILWNWLITPLYQGVPRSAIEPMLVPVFLPFNLLKAGLNSAFILLLYKPLVTALRKAHLVDAPKAPSAQKQIPWGIYILALFLLVTCILLVLVFQGKL